MGIALRSTNEQICCQTRERQDAYNPKEWQRQRQKRKHQKMKRKAIAKSEHGENDNEDKVITTSRAFDPRNGESRTVAGSHKLFNTLATS